MTPVPRPVPVSARHAGISRRLQWLTLIIGLSAAIATAFLKSRRAGFGVVIGTLLAWLNYRWLDRGVGALVTAAQAQAQEGQSQPRVPIGVYLRFGGRYILIGLAIYASVRCFSVPLLA